MRTTILAISVSLLLSSRPARADSGGTTIEDPSLLAGGVALAAAGIASSTAGFVLVAVVAPINAHFAFFGNRPDVSGYFEAGVPMLVVGALMTVGGIWMGIEGGRHVAQHVALAPFVSPHGGSVGLVGTF